MSNKFKSNKTDSTIQVFAFIMILFLILFLYKYFSTNYLYTDDLPKPDIRVRCPPKNTIIQQNLPSKQTDISNEHSKSKIEDASILMHENDLSIINNKFKLYQNTDIIDNPGFENELGNNTHIDKTLSDELNTVYIQTSAQSHINIDSDCSYSKAQKSDLPLANVPVFLLTNEKSLRLSDMPL